MDGEFDDATGDTSYDPSQGDQGLWTCLTNYTYLEDGKGRGHWFPCQVAGAGRDFGGISERRPILQKGDKFRLPGFRQEQRYAQLTLVARKAAAPPKPEWVQELVKQ